MLDNFVEQPPVYVFTAMIRNDRRSSICMPKNIWLPSCRINRKPSFLRILESSRAFNKGSLGIMPQLQGVGGSQILEALQLVFYISNKDEWPLLFV